MSHWDGAAERDLLMAILVATSNVPVRPDWSKAHKIMVEWGYSFSKEALSSRWSKKIMKEHKSKISGASTFAPGSTSTPRKRKQPLARARHTYGDSADDTPSDELPSPPDLKRRKRETPKRASAKPQDYGESDDTVDEKGNEAEVIKEEDVASDEFTPANNI